MTKSTILTGQFVRISLTPASIGERLLALLADFVVITAYFTGIGLLFERFISPHIGSNVELLLVLGIIIIPGILYPVLCETLNRGQTIGKRLLNLRVVNADGSSPGLGAALLRWLLLIIEGPVTVGSGLLVALLSRNHQRIGDFAAGTLVIKEKNYRKIQVSLDEFDYLMQNYQPVYPQAADLSLEQIDVIRRTLDSRTKDRPRRIALLAHKIQKLLAITPHSPNLESFLHTLLRDYQYYALEEI